MLSLPWLAALPLALGVCAGHEAEAPRPNVLLVTADDLGGRDCGWMGDPVRATPSVDALAARSHRFVNAHVVAPICQPSRAALMTGLLPHHNGTRGFEPLNDGVVTLPAHLRAHGYYTALVNKRAHMQPVKAFAWDRMATRAGREPEQWAEELATVFAAAKTAGKPFFVNANIVDPHRPFPGVEDLPELEPVDSAGRHWPQPRIDPADRGSPPARVFTADEIRVPGYLEDLPGVRTEVAQYYTGVGRMDASLAEILAALERAGHRDDTLVVFVGDNGASFPFAKATVRAAGTHEPVLLCLPGQKEAVAHEELVTTLDLVPTLCELVGVPPPSALDGRSWGPLLAGERQPERDHVVTYVESVNAGDRGFPQRAVRSLDSALIWNGWAGGPRMVVEAMSGLTMRTLVEASYRDEALAARMRQFLEGETLLFFDLRSDPDERVNRLNDPAQRAEVERQGARLLAHLERTADPRLAEFRAAWTAFLAPEPR